MQINKFDNGGVLDCRFTTPGTTMTGPLLLSGFVSGPGEAVHKQYVDTATNNISADSIVGGTFASARMPGLAGDISSLNGSTVVTLKPSGVVAGDYAKVTVNAKGLVTEGGSLIEADLPTFSWNKITTGKPTTLAGYGITDGVTAVNSTITGNLILSKDPTLATEVATKQYVDAHSSTGSNFSIGDIITAGTSTTPTGFLKCNGGETNSTTYNALYSIIGDTYSIPLNPGSGKPWQQQYAINSEQSTDITGWTTGTPLPAAVYSSKAIVTNNRVYLLGGYSDAGVTSTVYTAPINADGTLGTWTTGTPLPGALYFSQAIVTKNRVYLLGGSNGPAALSTVYTAPINADGTLGTWTTGTPLPDILHTSQAIVTKNRVYLLGGNIGPAAISTVYTAPINADGTLGTWTTGTPLPGAVSTSQAIVTKNRVYLLGGYSGTPISTVYTAPINADGTLGTWTTGTSLPVAAYGSQAIVTKNRVYLLGGYSDAGVTSTVYTAPINADGTLGTWTTGTPLPGALDYTQAIVTKNRVYLLGGSNGPAALSTVYTAPISGGLNDYSAYYDGTYTVTTIGTFKLPDYSANEIAGLYYYIKY